MITAGPHLLIVFDAIHDVVRAEKLLQARGVPCDLVPPPRDVSSDCGMVVACPPSAAPALQALAAEGRLAWRALVSRQPDSR